MKNHKAIIYTVISLLLIVGFFVVYSVLDTGDETIENTDIFECQASEVVEYSVSDGENRFVLVKSDDEWKVKDNEAAVLNQTKVQELVGNVAVISVHNVKSGIDSDEFEKMNRQTVEILLADGQRHEFEFAALNKEKCALRISGDDRIYLSHLSLMNILVAKLESLRVAFLFDGLNVTDEALSYYSYTDYDKNKTVVRLKTAAEASVNKNNAYIMEEPYLKSVDDELFEQQIAVNIPVLSAEKFVENPSDDLSVYGLDRESRAELSFVWSGAGKTLYMGKNENGLVYSKLMDDDEVFLVNASRLNFLKTEPFYIIDAGIMNSGAEKVSGLTVTKGDTVYKVSGKKLQGSDEALYYINDNAANQANFERIVEMLSEIKLKGELLTVPEFAEEIRFEIVFGEQQNRQTVYFVSATEKDYAMFEDGTATFAVDKEVVDGFIAELDAISKNPMKTGEKG